jgi:hypothetical protein
MFDALHLRRSALIISLQPREFMMNAHLIGNYHGQSVGYRFHDGDPVILRDDF